MFREGSQIGLYTLIRKLGRGGFGEVWLAERRAKFVTTKVAVKLPLDEQVDHEAIKHEATLWEQASGHPNIVPIIDADEYDGQIVIVSEYAPDGSLDEWLKTNGAMPIERAIETTIQILDGLEFLHSRNIIHRDLKPANILLQGTTPRLADFGISRALRTTVVSQSQNISGTFAYMSPEALDGKRSIQTDVWSVGVNLYQFLTGLLPFPHKEPSILFPAIIMREFEPLPDSISQSLQTVIAKALAKLPENRYASAGEMREDLFLLSRGKIISPVTKGDSAITEIETVIRPINEVNSIQTQIALSPLSSNNLEKASPNSVPIKTPKKAKPKPASLKTFVKLFISALMIVGFIGLFIKLFESYTKTNNSFPTNYNYSTNTISPNTNMPLNQKPTNRKVQNLTLTNTIINSNIMTNSATDIRNSTMMNSNVTYKDTNRIQEMPGNKYIRQESEQQVLKERAAVAVQSIENSMLQIAQKVSRSRHQSSNLQGCYSSESDFTMISETQYYRLYKCRMKGNILGVRTFEVGIKFTGEVVKQENNFIGRIVDSAILYDKEL